MAIFTNLASLLLLSFAIGKQPMPLPDVTLTIWKNGIADAQVDVRDKKVIARSAKERYPENFKPDLSGNKLKTLRIRGFFLGFPLDGETKEVLAQEKCDEGTRWHIDGGRFRFRVQVPDGRLKGWWIGRSADDRLILVQSPNDAIQFAHEDPRIVAEEK